MIDRVEGTIRPGEEQMKSLGRLWVYYVSTFLLTAPTATLSAEPLFQIDGPTFINSSGPNDTGADRKPTIVAASDGVILVAWTADSPDSDIYFSRSTDAGQTWTSQAPLNNNFGTDHGDDFEVAMATDGMGTWVAVWASTTSFPGAVGSDANIVCATSMDNGLTWSSPIIVDPTREPESTHEGDPAISTDSNGNWVVVWEGDGPELPQPGSSDIIVSRSSDNGLSWSPRARIDFGTSPDVGTDLDPSIAVQGLGNWMVVWARQQSGSPDFDIACARSQDAGVIWSAPGTLNSYGTSDGSSDHSPSLVTNGLGLWVVAWVSPAMLPSGAIGTSNDILFSRSLDDGTSWEPAGLVQTNGATDSAPDEEPHMVLDSLGNCWIAWESHGLLPNGMFSDDRDIHFSMGTQECSTWSQTIYGNGLAQSDAGFDFFPALAMVGLGHAVLVYQSDTLPNGSQGNDLDILASRVRQVNVVPASSSLMLALFAAGLTFLSIVMMRRTRILMC